MAFKAQLDQSLFQDKKKYAAEVSRSSSGQPFFKRQGYSYSILFMTLLPLRKHPSKICNESYHLFHELRRENPITQESDQSNQHSSDPTPKIAPKIINEKGRSKGWVHRDSDAVSVPRRRVRNNDKQRLPFFIVHIFVSFLETLYNNLPWMSQLRRDKKLCFSWDQGLV